MKNGPWRRMLLGIVHAICVRRTRANAAYTVNPFTE